MKKIGEIVLIFIAICGLPSIIQSWDSIFYTNHRQQIWMATILLTALISLTQFEIENPPIINRLFRILRHAIFKTKNIAIFLTIQLLISLILLFINENEDHSKTILLALTTNTIGINLLVILGKLTSSDREELLLHDPSNGKVYLFKRNRLKHIPDPETFNCFGFKWSDVTNLKPDEITKYKLDTPITSIKTMRILNHNGIVYGLVNEKLKHIPDPATLNYILLKRTPGDLENVSDIQGYSIDRPFVHFS